MRSTATEDEAAFTPSPVVQNGLQGENTWRAQHSSQTIGHNSCIVIFLGLEQWRNADYFAARGLQQYVFITVHCSK